MLSQVHRALDIGDSDATASIQVFYAPGGFVPVEGANYTNTAPPPAVARAPTESFSIPVFEPVSNPTQSPLAVEFPPVAPSPTLVATPARIPPGATSPGANGIVAPSGAPSDQKNFSSASVSLKVTFAIIGTPLSEAEKVFAASAIAKTVAVYFGVVQDSVRVSVSLQGSSYLALVNFTEGSVSKIIGATQARIDGLGPTLTTALNDVLTANAPSGAQGNSSAPSAARASVRTIEAVGLSGSPFRASRAPQLSPGVAPGLVALLVALTCFLGERIICK